MHETVVNLVFSKMFLSERLQLFSYLLSTMKDLYIKSISASELSCRKFFL